MSVNTIFITGTAKCIDNIVQYNVFLWGSKKGEPLQFIAPYEAKLSCYDELWRNAKDHAAKYFDCNKMYDGFYTQFLDHLTIIQ